jgi:putative DNA primase/helicase
MHLFSKAAPSYWDAGLPVIPLLPQQKRPALTAWQNYCDSMPTIEERAFWLEQYSGGNVGLPLGPASGLIAIDIDTDDPALIEAIKAALPPSPWVRVGKKGCVLVFRWQEGQKNFKLKDAQGRMVVECLGKGNQVVLPPSIHPDTGMPYTANCNLWDVLDDVQPPGVNFEAKLRTLVGVERRSLKISHVGEGGRHNLLISYSAQLRNKGAAGSELLAALEARNHEQCLPPLDGTEVAAIAAWADTKDGGDGLPYTDLGNAKRLVQKLAGQARYVPERKDWVVRDGHQWKQDVGYHVELQAKDVGEQLLAGSSDDKGRYAAGIKAQSERSIRAMVRLAQTEVGVAVSAAAFDRNPDTLSTAGGLVDLRTGQIRSELNEEFHSKLAGASFDPLAACPAFLTFLEQILPDRESRAYLQRWWGYCLTGLTSEQIILIIYGQGANGKSVLTNLLYRVLGDYARRTPMASLMQRRTDAATNDIAALQGARLILASEGNPGQKLDTALVKSLTGGDPITARFLHKEHVTFDPAGKIVVASNHLPEIDANDPAIWRRLHFLHLDKVFRDEQQDRTLPEKLWAERDGVLAWAVQGAVEWYKTGLAPPAAVRNAVFAYRTELDTIGAFLEERCVVDPASSVPAGMLYHAFCDFARAAGLPPANQTEFGRELGKRGFTARMGHSERRRAGLTLRTPTLEEVA